MEHHYCLFIASSLHFAILLVHSDGTVSHTVGEVHHPRALCNTNNTIPVQSSVGVKCMQIYPSQHVVFAITHLVMLMVVYPQ